MLRKGSSATSARSISARSGWVQIVHVRGIQAISLAAGVEKLEPGLLARNGRPESDMQIWLRVAGAAAARCAVESMRRAGGHRGAVDDRNTARRIAVSRRCALGMNELDQRR